MRITLSSLSKSAWAKVRANSVFPTPVGPRKMNDPMGRRGSLIPARARITASATKDTASSCPMTRSCKISSNRNNFSRSPSTNRVTGTPVHRDTVSAISSSVTASRNKRLSETESVSATLSCCSNAGKVPCINAAARWRSYCRSAASISRLVRSISSRKPRTLSRACFSRSHCTRMSSARICKSANSF